MDCPEGSGHLRMARATAVGMVMVRGECLPLMGALPLLPVASALEELAGLDSGRVLETAFERAPGFVRGEVGRLLPQLGPGAGPDGPGRGEGWRREQLFAGVAGLLDAVAGGSGAGLGLVVEDVHWADGECSPPLRMSMMATLRMRTPGRGEPRQAVRRAGFWWTGWRCGGQSVAAVASSVMAVRAEDSSTMVLPVA